MRDVDVLVGDDRLEGEADVTVADIAFERLPCGTRVGVDSPGQARRCELRVHAREIEIAHGEREACGPIGSAECDAPVASRAAAVRQRRVDRLERERFPVEDEARRQSCDRQPFRVDRSGVLVDDIERPRDTGALRARIEADARAGMRKRRIERRRIHCGELGDGLRKRRVGEGCRSRLQRQGCLAQRALRDDADLRDRSAQLRGTLRAGQRFVAGDFRGAGNAQRFARADFEVRLELAEIRHEAQVPEAMRMRVAGITELDSGHASGARSRAPVELCNRERSDVDRQRQLQVRRRLCRRPTKA